MEINKKLKTSFVSLLTLISSAISVVACGSKTKTDPGDKNYQDFVASVNKINKKDLAAKSSLSNFFYGNSYFKKKINIFSKDDPNIDFSISNFAPDLIKLYNKNNLEKKAITPTFLKNLKYNCISFDNDNVNIQLDKENVSLDNILFSQNFNLTFFEKNSINNKIKSMSFKNITVFFFLEKVNNTLYELDLKDVKFPLFSIDNNPPVIWDNIKLNNDGANRPDSSSYNLGYVGSENNLATGKMASDPKKYDNWEWYVDEKEQIVSKTAFLFTIGSNDKISLSEKDQSIKITCDSFVTRIEIDGKVRKKPTTETLNIQAGFFGMFDAKNPKLLDFKYGNYIVIFNL